MALHTTKSEHVTAFREPSQRLQTQVSDYPGGFSVSFPVRFRQALWGLVGIVLLTLPQVAHATFS